MRRILLIGTVVAFVGSATLSVAIPAKAKYLAKPEPKVSLAQISPEVRARVEKLMQNPILAKEFQKYRARRVSASTLGSCEQWCMDWADFMVQACSSNPNCMYTTWGDYYYICIITNGYDGC